MKTFKDLEFKQDPVFPDCEQAIMNFDNGYGVSVLFGNKFYSNREKNLYEVAILYNGELVQPLTWNDSVLGWVSSYEITKLMLELQNKGKKSRQEYNYLIAALIKEKYPQWNDLIIDTVIPLIDKYPDQRFGQIICNYICPDYRNEKLSPPTKQFMSTIFPIKMDPFYEESSKTYKRLNI